MREEGREGRGRGRGGGDRERERERERESHVKQQINSFHTSLTLSS